MSARPCAFCEGRSYRRWCTVKGFDIGRCTACGLVQVLQDMSDEELKQIYGEGYYNGQDSFVYQSYMADPEAKIRHFGQRLEEICRDNGIRMPGRCLEIGCAYGLFLVAARQRGWIVRGIEMSAHAAQSARESFGLDVSSDSNSIESIETDSMDLVVMWDVIEHVKYPLRLLEQVRRVLVPGGLTVFTTMDLGSLGGRLYGKRWFQICPPYHLIYWEHDSVRKVLEKAGFMIRDIANCGGHPLENMGRNRALQWIARHDRYLGWRFKRGGPDIKVTALKPSNPP
jgi:2-polyprenyl-3-methyl-5-hydroxy-6-metoxy-1,4-benzoquinol methylase